MAPPNLPQTSTCAPWCQPTDVTQAVDSTGALLPTINAPVLDLCCQVASDILYRMSGRQFPGNCQDTVRPQARMVSTDHGRPILSGGMAVGFGYWSGGWSGFGYSRFGWCTCNQEEMPGGNLLPSVDLGVWPLTGIVEVLVDGAAIDPTSYRIDDNRHLVRLADLTRDNGIPASAPNYGWPCCQRMDLAATEPGTWEVTFTYGVPPPPGGILGAQELAWQLYLSANPAQGVCAVPGRTTTVQRQGITAHLLDPEDFISRGRTGLVLSDLFIESCNPNSLPRRSTIMSPDLGPRVRRTGPVG